MISKENKMKAFRKKRAWPSVILFTLAIVFSLVLNVAFIGLFVTYISDVKIKNICDEAALVGRLIQENMKDEEAELLDVVEYVTSYLNQGSDICITDKDNQVIRIYGENIPDFEGMSSIEFQGTYTVFADTALIIEEGKNFAGSIENIIGEGFGENEDDTLENTLKEGQDGDTSEDPEYAREDDEKRAPDDREFGIPVYKILSRVFASSDFRYGAESWRNESIFSTSCWVRIPVVTDDYILYFRDDVNIARNDVMYVCAISIIALLVFIVPLILLLTNIISGITNQKQMAVLIYMDAVTGGNNWFYFTERSQMILRKRKNAKNAYAVVNLHLDRYSDYCTCYGNKDGEKLLKSINGFLQAKLEKGEVYGRLGGADFGLLLRYESDEQIQKRIKKLIAELVGIREDRKLIFRAGIYVIEASNRAKEIQKRRETDIEQVYNYANAARNILYDGGKQLIAFFNEQILNEQLWKNKVENTMETALLNQEFQVYLQPKYNPSTGKMMGAEALVRWISPADGFISPNKFIPIFEENGFITKLDDYMLSMVAKLLSEWKIQKKKLVPISVNISRANFTKIDLAEHICQIIDDYGTEHEYIELELTESAFFGNKETLHNTIKELKAYGFKVSMDDFGAGYSSLNSLKDLPIDVLKLDMEFFRGEDIEKRGEIVVKETIQLAKNLNIKVVAEGIERKEQVDFLAQQGCDMIQGFYYAKPMPVSEFAKKVETDY